MRIGLSLVKELVQIHGGAINVTSVPEEGTEFVLSLPREQPLPAGYGTPAEESKARTELDYARLESAGLMSLLTVSGGEVKQITPDSKATVQVVEDSPDMREYIRRGIEPHFRVLEASDGQEGLSKAWEQEAERELKRIARSGGTASIAFLDLDDFKRVNDNHGPQVGDQVLVELAKTVVGQLRATDLVGRYGGEEFVLLLPDSPGEAAVRSVERILQLFRGQEIGGQALHSTSSAGVAEIRSVRTHSLAEYVTCADAAMYDAKRRGKAQVLVWSEATAR